MLALLPYWKLRNNSMAKAERSGNSSWNDWYLSRHLAEGFSRNNIQSSAALPPATIASAHSGAIPLPM
jgi:hypothetical protein